jgi:hypothetical protein
VRSTSAPRRSVSLGMEVCWLSVGFCIILYIRRPTTDH